MSGFKVCLICKESFHFQSGKFSNHLKESHSLSPEKYSIIYEWNNNPPKCGCGYCDENAPFFRGKFKENFIYPEHRNPNWKKTQYIKKHGKPICKSCGEEHDNFNRGIPRKHCSKCVKDGKINQNNPEPFRRGRKNAIKTMIKRYGVDNPGALKKNRIKASERIMKYNSNWRKNHSIKKYKNTELYYQSSYELDFLELCESKNILDKISNGNSYKYLDESHGHWLLTDFCLDKKYEIEIKSSYILKRQGGIFKIFEKKKSVENSGMNYIFILNKDYTEFLNIISNGYEKCG